eukprot:EG_transcript_13694
MFHPPLDGDIAQALRPQASSLAAASDLDSLLVLKLLCIAATNAHAYIGQAEIYVERWAAGSPRPRAEQSALFARGSKAAHSCNPNAAYSSRTGELVYTAICPIREGDQVTLSYIARESSLPTPHRRRRLLQTKDFLCRCERCVRPDCARAVWCPRRCGGCMLPCGEGEGDTWQCARCGPVDGVEVGPVRQLEQDVETDLADLQRLTPNPLKTLALLVDLSERVSQTLSPVHFTRIAAQDTLAQLYVAACRSETLSSAEEMHVPELASAMRLQAAKATAEATKLCECVRAGCYGGATCAVTHDACYDRNVDMFWAGQDLLRASHGMDLREAGVGPLCATLGRYLPLMRINYGADDTDVVDIERLLHQLGRPPPPSACAAAALPPPLECSADHAL